MSSRIVALTRMSRIPGEKYGLRDTVGRIKGEVAKFLKYFVAIGLNIYGRLTPTRGACPWPKWRTFRL